MWVLACCKNQGDDFKYSILYKLEDSADVLLPV